MTLDDIELPDDLLWVNEYQWQPVAQETERTLTGALLVQEQAKLYGREIELSGEQSGLGGSRHRRCLENYGSRTR